MTLENKEQECKKCGRVFGSVKCFDVDCPNNTQKITMNQEDKELLLKDLCSRLNTNLVCSIYRTDDEGVGYRDEVLYGYCRGDIWYEFYFGEDCGIGIDDVSKIKPYLLPLSNMTEEQAEEMQEIVGSPKNACIMRKTDGLELWLDSIDTDPTMWLDTIFEVQDWLNKNHFDYRGLIEKGLAIEAPEGMYN